MGSLKGRKMMWVDPDDGVCSKVVTVLDDTSHPDVTWVIDAHGCDMECYSSELEELE